MNAEILREWLWVMFWLCAVGVPAAALLYSLFISLWEKLAERRERDH